MSETVDTIEGLMIILLSCTGTYFLPAVLPLPAVDLPTFKLRAKTSSGAARGGVVKGVKFHPLSDPVGPIFYPNY